VRGRGIGFDYVHAVIDDHTRLAYLEPYPDEKGATAEVECGLDPVRGYGSSGELNFRLLGCSIASRSPRG